MEANKKISGTAHGEMNEAFVFLTKRIRIPRANILSVVPSRDGQGATVVTTRGAFRVCEDYGALAYHLYGTTIPTATDEAEGGAR